MQCAVCSGAWCSQSMQRGAQENAPRPGTTATTAVVRVTMARELREVVERRGSSARVESSTPGLGQGHRTAIPVAQALIPARLVAPSGSANAAGPKRALRPPAVGVGGSRMQREVSRETVCVRAIGRERHMAWPSQSRSLTASFRYTIPPSPCQPPSRPQAIQRAVSCSRSCQFADSATNASAAAAWGAGRRL